MKTFVRLGAAVATAAALVAAPAAADDPLKVGFVYVSPVGSAGWTFSHDQARLHLERELAGRVTTSFVEKVPEGADAERVIRQLAQSGHRLIFTTSFGYMDPTIKVASRFPETVFMHATGYKRSTNVGTYIARFYEGRYLAGVVAGRMSKTNTAGYVAAFPIPEVVRGINAFTLGMRSVNPDAQVRVIWVSSWYDPGKEREAAETLISQGADVIMQHTDSTAPVQAAEARGVHAIGYHSDMSKFGPRAHLTASVHDWSAYYVKVTREVLDGTWKSGAVWWGIREGMVKMAPFNESVPEDVRALVAEREAAIRDGTLHPFQGPVRDQSGTVRVPEGQAMSDDDLLRTDWYVEGVVGSLPRR